MEDDFLVDRWLQVRQWMVWFQMCLMDKSRQIKRQFQ